MRRALVIAVAGLVVASAGCSAGGSDKEGYGSPEETIGAYIDGIADGDMDKVLSAWAVHQPMSFTGVAEQELGAFNTRQALPDGVALYDDINATHMAELAANSVQQIVTTLNGYEWARTWTDDPARYVQALDPENLTDLDVVTVAQGQWNEQATETRLAFFDKNAQARGVDEVTTRAALISHAGSTWLVRFELVKADGRWMLYRPGSSDIYLEDAEPDFGVPVPMTEQEFTDLLVHDTQED